ncbi:MAG: HD domain-containing protein [Rhodospirillaceae bacterium]|nr:HD domain-containing protein [Rhodospirillaceae bacterium]
MTKPSVLIAEVERLFAERGATAYFGEPVTTAAHSLQSAALAERHGAGPALVAAALLHDIGHLLHALGEDVAEHGVDTRHEDAGADFLAAVFPPEVSEPVRLHVAAKRCLCRIEPGYFDRLSPASVRSLALQGGPMAAEEAADFLGDPYGAAAVALRRWDDDAKVPGADVPGLAYYLPLLRRLAGA